MGWSHGSSVITLKTAASAFDPSANCFDSDSVTIECESNGFAQWQFTVPSSGYYSFSVPAFVAFGSGVYFTPFIDNIPIEHGIDAVSGSDYTYEVQGGTSPYTASSIYLYAGQHTLQLGPELANASAVFFNAPTITLTSLAAPPAESAGTRDPTIQPLRSYNIWNTAIGSGATWCAQTDGDCATLEGLANSSVNAGSFSEPVYVASNSDPLITIKTSFNGLPTLISQIITNWNTGFTVAPGGDSNIVVYDPTHSFIMDGYNCSITSSPYSVSCSPIIKESVCDGANGAGLGAVVGLMRTSEIQAQLYPHMLQYALSKDAMKAEH